MQTKNRWEEAAVHWVNTGHFIVKANPHIVSKWELFHQAHPELKPWSHGDWYDVKHDTAYIPTTDGGYKTLEGIADPFSDIPILGPTAGVRLAQGVVALERLGIKLLPSLSKLVTQVSGVWSKNEVEKGIGLTTRLNRTQIKGYLANIHTIPREQLIQDLESVGFKFKGSAEDGRFMDFIDKQGNLRVKLHPPDRITQYDHIHIYNKRGQDLNTELSTVSYKSPEGHIQMASDDFNYSQEYYNRITNGR